MDEIAALKQTIREQETRLRELEAGERRLRAFVELASQAVVAIDPGGTIILVNAKTEEMFGYTRDELIGAGMEILLPEPLRGQHTMHRTDYFDAPRTRPMGVGMELRGRKKNGLEFPVEISLSFVQETDRRLALALITDISERKRLEQQMRQTQKLESLGVMAGGVAHDFNNLLTGIVGNASLVLEQVPSDHPVYPHLKDIVEAGEQAAELTRQLLAYAGKAHFQVRRLDIGHLIRDVLGLVRSSIPAGVRVDLDVAEHLPPVAADPSQLQQLFMNLVINAGEAIGKESGVICIAASVVQAETPVAGRISGTRVPPGQYVTIEVADNGCGMNEATVARIFDPFFTTKFTGRGLGLAAARGIVDTHHGAIQVFSHPGEGSTFRVLLPAISGTTAQPASSSADDLSGSGVILVVDDEEVVRQTAKGALQRYGYTVLLAEDGPSALDQVRNAGRKICAVVLDLSIPGTDVGATLRHIKTLCPEVPVLVSSGFGEMEAAVRLGEGAVAGFVQKPYTAATLARHLKRACTTPPRE